MGVRQIEDFPFDKIDRPRRKYLAAKIHQELVLVEKSLQQDANDPGDDQLPVKQYDDCLEGTMCTVQDIQWLKESSDPTVLYVMKHLTQHPENAVFPKKVCHSWPWRDEDSWRFYARTVDLLNSEAILLSTERVTFTRANWTAWIVLVIIVSSLLYLGIWFLLPASFACLMYVVVISFWGGESDTDHWFPLESKNDWDEVNQTIRKGSHSHEIPEPIEEAIREHSTVSFFDVLFLILQLPSVVIVPILQLAVNAIPCSEEENVALLPEASSGAEGK